MPLSQEDFRKLIEQGKKMRTLQRRFFSEKDKQIRSAILDEAKTAERQFDNMIFNFEQLIK